MKKKMKTRFLLLLVVLGVSVLVFVWGTANYWICYTDTPDYNSPPLCMTNLDIFATPASIAAFVVIGAIPILTWMKTKTHRLGIVFTILSGVGIFFAFVGILSLILMVWI